ncbi:MAG: hypothetical protein Q8K66_00325 [Sediminibacterium sp.]|nr:hypothetical protein [Sediminibacterium sp.]MDP3129466.1 hypothetical protein [Sediminibacterium sp.]
MKQTFLFLILATSFLTAKSQLNSGSWLVGGSGSFYSYNEKYSTPTYNQTAKYTSADISGTVGYFIVDKFVAGVRPYFSSYKEESIRPNGGTTNSFRFAIGPFARYYFLQADKPFNLLTDISYQFGINRQVHAPDIDGKFNDFSVMGGTEVFFNTAVGMEILFGYSQKIRSIGESPNALYTNKKGFQVSIGFTLHLEKL